MNRGLLLLVFANPALGEEIQQPSWQGPGVMKLLETAFWLGCILALILLLARFVRGAQQAPRGGGNQMRVVSALHLGNREKVLLVEVADTHVLLGATPQSISSLHVFHDLDSAQLTETGQADFSSILSVLAGAGKS